MTKNSRTNNFHINSPYQVLAYNFFNRYNSSLQVAYRQDSSFFITPSFFNIDNTLNPTFSNLCINNIQKNKFKPFTGYSFIDFTVRLQNKPNSWKNLNLCTELNQYEPVIKPNSKLLLNSSYINLDRKSQVSNNNYVMGILRKNISEEDSYIYSYKDHQEDSR